MMLLKELKNFAEANEEILLGYLFGSQTSGQVHSKSDIDVALFLNHTPSFEDRIRLTSELIKYLGENKIDLVLLNEAPPLLRYEVVAEGQLFFERNEDVTNDFEMRTFSEYFDTEHLRQVQNRLLKESILGNT